jgi:hypothetical protein
LEGVGLENVIEGASTENEKERPYRRMRRETLP